MVHIKCVSRLGYLILRNKDGQEALEWLHMRKEGKVFHWDMLSFLGMRAESKERPQQKAYTTGLGMRLGD